MTKKTHSSGGFLVASLGIYPFIFNSIERYSIIYKLLLIFLYYHFADLGSSFPDIDMKSSYISKRYPLLSKYFGKNCRHRGITHSIIFLLTLGIGWLFLIYVSQFNIVIHVIGFGFYIGYGSHIILDLFNTQGVELFYPCKINLKVLSIRTNSSGEKLFNGIINFLTSLLLIYYLFLYFKVY